MKITVPRFIEVTEKVTEKRARNKRKIIEKLIEKARSQGIKLTENRIAMDYLQNSFVFLLQFAFPSFL